MTKITVAKYESGQYRVRASGHTGYAESGSDIVCAAVSAVVQAAGLGVKYFCPFAYAESEGDGEYVIELPAGTRSAEAEAVLTAMLLALRDLAATYPRHIILEEIEND